MGQQSHPNRSTTSLKLGIQILMPHLGKCRYMDLLVFVFPTQRIYWDFSQKLLTESCSKVKKRWLVLGCRAQRGQCLVAKGSLIDGTKRPLVWPSLSGNPLGVPWEELSTVRRIYPPLFLFLIKFTADLTCRPRSSCNSMEHGKRNKKWR